MSNATRELEEQLEFMDHHVWVKETPGPGMCCLLFAVPDDADERRVENHIEDFQVVRSEAGIEAVAVALEEQGYVTSSQIHEPGYSTMFLAGDIVNVSDNLLRNEEAARAVLVRAIEICKEWEEAGT